MQPDMGFKLYREGSRFHSHVQKRLSSMKQQEEQKPCTCIMEGIPLSSAETHLAGDSWMGEVSFEVCDNCGQYWLNLLYEPNVYEGDDHEDGEYYFGPISAQILETMPQGDENILVWTLDVLSSLDWYYYSYFWESYGHLKTSGPFSFLLMDHRSPLVQKWQEEHQKRS